MSFEEISGEKRPIDETTVKKVEVDTDIVKCPNCGATLHYDIASGKLKCGYCETTKDIPATATEEIPYTDADTVFGVKYWTNESIAYRCDACGAVSVMNKYDIAEKCPFCGVTNIVPASELQTILPNAILPFRITIEKAREAFNQWVRKRFYAPRPFKKSFVADKVNGSYLPAWTFDLITTSTYKGVLGKTETKTVGSGKNRRTVTTVKWFPVSGQMGRNYDDFIIEASKSVTQSEITKILPFDTKIASGYNEAYLAGFTAERYDKDVHVALSDAKAIVYEEYEKAIMAKYNADKIKHLDIDIAYRKITYKYILLPVWIDNYKYHEKRYRILVNGRNGKVGGKTPISALKVALTVIVLGGIAALLVYLDNVYGT